CCKKESTVASVGRLTAASPAAGEAAGLPGVTFAAVVWAAARLPARIRTQIEFKRMRMVPFKFGASEKRPFRIHQIRKFTSRPSRQWERGARSQRPWEKS